MLEKRLKIAMEFLKSGQSSRVGSLTLSNSNPEVFTVTGWSQYLVLLNLTRRSSLNEIQELKETFFDMVRFSNELESFISNKTIEYNLCYDDGGNVGIHICSEISGILEWKLNLQ